MARVNTRQGSNRGFKSPRRQSTQNPKIARVETPGRTLEGPKVKPTKAPKPLGIWPNPPAEWGYSLGEWIVKWYLQERRHFVEGTDYYHQSFAYVPFLFANTNRTNVDFVIPYGPGTKLGINFRFKALIFDPYVDFTHDREFDLKRKQALYDEGYDLVFFEAKMLERDTENVIERGLLGQDLSDRGQPFASL